MGLLKVDLITNFCNAETRWCSWRRYINYVKEFIGTNVVNSELKRRGVSG